jgi:hypothetical protein
VLNLRRGGQVKHFLCQETRQGIATTEPQGRLRARNPAPGFLKNATAEATNVASSMPRSIMNRIMATQ